MKPTVGRIVHYVSYGTPEGEYPKACRAAVVTEVGSVPPGSSGQQPEVGLCVLNPEGQFFNRCVGFDHGIAHAPEIAKAGFPLPPALCDGRDHAGGTWHWPERAGHEPGDRPERF